MSGSGGRAYRAGGRKQRRRWGVWRRLSPLTRRCPPPNRILRPPRTYLQAHLDLANARYERDHYEGELAACRAFRFARSDADVGLCPLDVFWAEAPDDLLAGLDRSQPETGGDPHSLAAARLEWERRCREREVERTAALRAERDQAKERALARRRVADATLHADRVEAVLAELEAQLAAAEDDEGGEGDDADTKGDDADGNAGKETGGDDDGGGGGDGEAEGGLGDEVRPTKRARG